MDTDTGSNRESASIYPELPSGSRIEPETGNHQEQSKSQVRRASGEKVLAVVYDLRESPPTHDFINWLVRAEYWRKLHQGDALEIFIYRGYRFRSNRDYAYTQERRERKIWDLLVPLAKLNPLVRDVYVVDPVPGGKQQFSYLNLEQIVPPTLKASSISRSIISNFLREREIVNPVTITIRQSDFEKPRNSRNEEWNKVGHWLKERGLTPIVIPDAEATMLGKETRLDFLHYYPATAPDIRLALYEQCVLNLITTSGPMVMLMHSEAPMMAFKILVPGIKCCTEKYMGNSRMTPNDDWGPNKKFYWKDDTFENIVPELEKELPKFQSLYKPRSEADVFSLKRDYCA